MGEALNLKGESASDEGAPFAFCSVADLSSRTEEVTKYNLQTDAGSHKGFVIAKLHRDGGSWSFEAIGGRCDWYQATDQEIEPQARAYT